MNTRGFRVKTTELDMTFDPHGHSSVDNISRFHKTSPECARWLSSALQMGSLKRIKKKNCFVDTHSLLKDLTEEIEMTAKYKGIW